MVILVVNRINPVDLLTSYVSKIHFNVILSSTARSYTQEMRDAATEEGIGRSTERKDESKFCFPDCAVNWANGNRVTNASIRHA
jgi:hypothetical protein